MAFNFASALTSSAPDEGIKTADQECVLQLQELGPSWHQRFYGSSPVWLNFAYDHTSASTSSAPEEVPKTAEQLYFLQDH